MATPDGPASYSFHDYLKIALLDENCFRSDDLVLSNFLVQTGIMGESVTE